MAESRFDVAVEHWSCSVSNQHRKAYGDRKIRQRTVMRLEGTVQSGADQLTAAVYLTFERGAQDFAPIVSATEHPDERIRIDAYLQHGQEAAVLAVLQSGYRTWARFSENALGQTAVVLESSPEREQAASRPRMAE